MSSVTERLAHLQGMVKRGEITPAEVKSWTDDESAEHLFETMVSMVIVADHLRKYGVNYYRKLPEFEKSLKN